MEKKGYWLQKDNNSYLFKASIPGVGVFVSSRVHKHIQFVKAADDASYLWLKLKAVVLGCPEVYFAVCYMPQRIL